MSNYKTVYSQSLRLHLVPLQKPMITPPIKNNGIRMDRAFGLTDDQIAKMKPAVNLSEPEEAIHDNQSLSEDQKKTQFEALHNERQNSFKSILTATQISKLDQMKMNHGDGKEKMKSDGWKEKEKVKTAKKK